MIASKSRHVPRPALAPECSPDDGGITLPAGFCASIFADTIGVARHLLVAPNGDVLVSVGDADAAGTTHMRGDKRAGAIVALRDTNHDGRADLQVRTPVGNGTGIALWKGFLYFTDPTTVMRLPWSPAKLGVSGNDETVVDGFPGRPGHGSLALAIDDDGNLFVGVGSAGNMCMSNRTALDPCPQLGQRAGIWRYRADKVGQRHPLNGTLVATGIRNPVAMTWSKDLKGLYSLSHGRDALHQNFPKLYSSEAGAENPAEEFARIETGDDWGWPYCYYDLTAKKKLARAGIRRRCKDAGSLRDGDKSTDRISRALGARRTVDLQRHDVPGALSRRRVRRLSWLVESRAQVGSGLQRRVRAVREREADWAPIPSLPMDSPAEISIPAAPHIGRSESRRGSTESCT